MARAWSTRRAAWFAAGLAAATGLITFYEVLILQASIDVALATAALLALTWALKGRGARWFLFAGIVFGLAALNRPNMAIAAAGLAAVLPRKPDACVLPRYLSLASFWAWRRSRYARAWWRANGRPCLRTAG